MKKSILLAVLLYFCATLTMQAQTIKGDPWIFNAYQDLYNRKPNAWEVNIKNYNKGSWGNYGDLKKYVAAYQAGLSAKGVTINTYFIPGTETSLVCFNRNGKQVAINIVSNDGGKVLQAGGLSISSLPVANQVANLLASTIKQFSPLLGAFFGGKYTVQAAGTTVIPTSGDGALIFQ